MVDESSVLLSVMSYPVMPFPPFTAPSTLSNISAPLRKAGTVFCFWQQIGEPQVCFAALAFAVTHQQRAFRPCQLPHNSLCVNHYAFHHCRHVSQALQRSIHHYRNDSCLSLHAEPSQIWAHNVANRTGHLHRIFFLRSSNSDVFDDIWPRVISEGLAAMAANCMIWNRMHLGKACIGVWGNMSWKSCIFLICAKWKLKNKCLLHPKIIILSSFTLVIHPHVFESCMTSLVKKKCA